MYCGDSVAEGVGFTGHRQSCEEAELPSDSPWASERGDSTHILTAREAHHSTLFEHQEKHFDLSLLNNLLTKILKIF